MDDCEQALREGIVLAGRLMIAGGLVKGTSGNISARWQDGFIITPSGMPYHEVRGDDLVFLRPPPWIVKGKPSSEWLLHRDIYASRDDIRAIVHTHSPYATALSISRKDIPAVHEMIGISGGRSILCAEFAASGTQELSANAIVALRDRTCCLLANHGVVATGSSVASALRIAEGVEVLAKLYHLALQIEEPNVLIPTEVSVVEDHEQRRHGYWPR